MNWASDVPQKDGMYWMYGFKSEYDQEQGGAARMHLVELRTNKHSKFFVTQGHFIYEKDFSGRSLWAIAKLPDAPDGLFADFMGW